jgi:hypothetical protein
MLDENGLGNDRACAARAGKPSNRDDQMKEKSDEVAHSDMLADSKMPRIRPF